MLWWKTFTDNKKKFDSRTNPALMHYMVSSSGGMICLTLLLKTLYNSWKNFPSYGFPLTMQNLV